MANAKVIIEGRFLCSKNYRKKDKEGNLSNDVVKQILVFDGDNAVKILDVDGSKLNFGDTVKIKCDMYAGDYGVMFRASADS